MDAINQAQTSAIRKTNNPLRRAFYGRFARKVKIMFDTHTIETPNNGYGFNQKGRIMLACAFSQTTAAGSGAGVAVQFVVSGLVGLPTNFGVLVNPGQDATWYISAKNSTGFTINLTPRLAANTLATGSIDWFLFA